MDEEISTVLRKLYEELKGLTDEKLNDLKLTLKEDITKQDINQSDRSQKVWDEVFPYTLDFTYNDKLLTALKDITKRDLVSLFESMFITNPKKISVQVISIIYVIFKIYNPATPIPDKGIEYYTLNRSKITKIIKDITFFKGKSIIKNEKRVLNNKLKK